VLEFDGVMTALDRIAERSQGKSGKATEPAALRANRKARSQPGIAQEKPSPDQHAENQRREELHFGMNKGRQLDSVRRIELPPLFS
jgi:hypothetical protein